MLYIMKKYTGKSGGRLVVVKCKNCNSDFEALAIKVRLGKGIYCSSDCYNSSRKSSEESKKEKNRLHQKKHKYGLSQVEYNRLIESSGNKCQICKKVFENVSRYTSPCIDHCHNSGEVRGVLCNKCNTALGLFRDSAEILKSAIDYLKKRP